jgi:hypothetical protein
MKGLITLLSLLVSAGLIWYTLEADQAHAAQEQQQAQAYLAIIETDIKRAARQILADVPPATRISAIAKYLSPQHRQQLQTMHRYNDELDACFTHHMQVIYLRHDGVHLYLETDDALLLTIAVAETTDAAEASAASAE